MTDNMKTIKFPGKAIQVVICDDTASLLLRSNSRFDNKSLWTCDADAELARNIKTGGEYEFSGYICRDTGRRVITSVK